MLHYTLQYMYYFSLSSLWENWDCILYCAVKCKKKTIMYKKNVVLKCSIYLNTLNAGRTWTDTGRPTIVIKEQSFTTLFSHFYNHENLNNRTNRSHADEKKTIIRSEMSEKHCIGPWLSSMTMITWMATLLTIVNNGLM